MAQLGDTTVYGSVDARGIVTQSKQPAFSAKLAARQNMLAVSTFETIIGWTETFDANNNFNPTTGIFTAPVTGKYQLNTTVDFRNVDSAAGYNWIRIATESGSYGQLMDPNFTADDNYRGFSVASLVALTAGQTAWVVMYQSGGTIQAWAEVTWTGFSGYLVC